MTDVHASEWIGLAGVVVSAFSAGWAVRSARRASRAEEQADNYQATAEQQANRATLAAEEAATAQRRSAQAAEKAATAQQQSADAAQRAADALEKQNHMAEDLAAAAEGVPWRIEYREGALWELWNDSDFPKYRVQIGGPAVVAHRTRKLIDRIDGHSSHEFWGNTSWTGTEPRVDVTWHRRPDGDDNPLPWSGRLPPRP